MSQLPVADPMRLLPYRRLAIGRSSPDLRISLLRRVPASQPAEGRPGRGARPGRHRAPRTSSTSGSPAAGRCAGLASTVRQVTSYSPEAPSVLRMPSGTARLRLRVREAERIPALPPSSAVPAEFQDRTLFVDVVPLPPGRRPG